MTYRLFGVELSPYSIKLRSYLRYKQIAHQWIVSDRSQREEIKKYSKLPLIPVLVSPQGEAMQDSTPIIKRLEQENPTPSIIPEGEISPFISLLLEEHADEWCNKHMFHYRWAYPANQTSASRRIAALQLPDRFWAKLPILRWILIRNIASVVKARMIPRLHFVGSNPDTASQIVDSFENFCALLEKHLATRDFIFGKRPSLADFAIWGQLYTEWTDPTPKAHIHKNHPRLEKWIKMMQNPQAQGEWEPWDEIAPTLMPILQTEVADLFFPWSHANAKALVADEKRFSVTLKGKNFNQDTQKYHARSLGVICQAYQTHKNPALDDVLRSCGCLQWLEKSQ